MISTPTPSALTGGSLTLPTASQVTLLQAVQGYPTVSLLMNTTPAPRMLPDDAARLAGMAREAVRRLEDESLPGVAGSVLEPLRDLVGRAADLPTATAVAVYCASAVRAVVHLSVTVADRVVVDPTFATRDLVRALHRTPRHVVLALSLHEARLFEGLGRSLQPAGGRSFPRVGPSRQASGARGATAANRSRDARDRRPTDLAQRQAYYREVDRALGAYLRVNPAPLVLIGTDRLLAEFSRVSENLGRLAGCVRGSLVSAPRRALVARVDEVLRSYLTSRQQEALDVLDRRVTAGRVAAGIQSCWLAARSERPEMLAVEEGYFCPARLDPAGDLVSVATDVEHPEVIDDLVDELIELVIRRGGWVALVEDGALAAHGRVALAVRR